MHAVTVRDFYPLLCMDKCIKSGGEVGIYFTLDANSGYSQVEIDERDPKKSASSSHDCRYQFLRMLLGLESAPAAFKWEMGNLLLPLLRDMQAAIVYLKDIDVFSETVNQPLKRLEPVLTLL